MCCFTGPVKDVSNTKIFARMGVGVEQYIAYAMSLESETKLAMVLPIPVIAGSGEDAVKFINLHDYPTLFDDLHAGFPANNRYPGGGMIPAAIQAPPQQKLKVNSVGSYDASFVPTIADFSRLDERFRLPNEVWAKLPGYKNYGFAVFKLKALHGPVHPMAFSFPSAMLQSLFFPTLHIHDGQIHAKEHFDHTLYAQGSGINAKGWEESPGIAGQFVKESLTQGMISSGHHVYRKQIYGLETNGDILLRATKLPA
ncbi:hypothetical protein BH11VER1_BH11VER1_23470 [soil metagenome]